MTDRCQLQAEVYTRAFTRRKSVCVLNQCQFITLHAESRILTVHLVSAKRNKTQQNFQKFLRSQSLCPKIEYTRAQTCQYFDNC